MDIQKVFFAKQELEKAQSEFKPVVENFNQQQRQYKHDLLIVFEKMGLYSAGIISLSVTFLGYILSRNSNVLVVKFFYLPTYVYLYISWAVFVISLLGSIFIRWVDSIYLFFNSQSNYHKTRKQLEEKHLEMLQNYPNMIFSPDRTKEIEIAICQKNIEILNKDLITDTTKKENFYYLILKVFQRVTVLAFILGLILLVLFAVKATSTLIMLK